MQLPLLKPAEETVGISPEFEWDSWPAVHTGRTRPQVWYVALPLTSGHRGSHSGGGLEIAGGGDQSKYSNEGTVYPHSSLVEMITYQARHRPDLLYRYWDISHETIDQFEHALAENTPSVVAFTVYTATYLWALILALMVKRANPSCIVVFGNDHAANMAREILESPHGRRAVDFVSIGNNGPFTMMGLLSYLDGHLPIERVPSVAYRTSSGVVTQTAVTYPLRERLLPDYRLIEPYLSRYYDKAFQHWYGHHYDAKRMVTIAIDGGCHWGRNPASRCKHCSILGLTPKTAALERVIETLELTVGQLGANVYAAGDSTLGFSKAQWNHETGFLDDLAAACDASPILRGKRFLLAYGLVKEFLQSARMCRHFVQTWNVGIEAFDPGLLRHDSKGINRGAALTWEAFDLARTLDYRIYVSGILGLPGTTVELLRKEVEQWLKLADTYKEIITTVSVSAPAVIPGSRMYWELLESGHLSQEERSDIVPCQKLTRRFLAQHTSVTLEEVAAAVKDVGAGVTQLKGRRGQMVKFGGFMYGGVDEDERKERELLHRLLENNGRR